ncbi:hypothetical protein PFICI_07320 [Pestalotiopsis fici W106-1]|uniref:Uncharacterized protein n=1 Tax=Pestalotiopsis fici (strain W106-1 / CGMCC3.15140) TaxID=1229662 RepID=W3X871_PESFW|nr:uncharacterized protein PFICI_07320 [Pestalotiopsis fici W106-1]ETS82318.1 hypothetical protein PFICI_07320 [Pestalotiopsis fici W106-1]
MATIALPRPIAPHRSSSGIVTLPAPITLDTQQQQQPVPNKHLPVCPTGPALSQDPNTPPPSPLQEAESRQASLLYPPDKYIRVDSGPLSLYKINAADVAAALDYQSRQPLPDPSLVFPWFHGLHPSNHVQQAFFIARRKALRRTPVCLRGVTIVKADGDLTCAKLKGAIAPADFLQPGSVGQFLDVDPKEGFSVRNFQIQTAKSAMTSDVIIYGDNANTLRDVAWKVASAQAKWRERHEDQRDTIPLYSTFICSSPFSIFEKDHAEIVSIDGAGELTGDVLDFFQQERLEMYAMTKASEISSNVWLGPTPEPSSDEERQYDILIECSDLGRLNPSPLHAIANGSANCTSQIFLDFPSSGSILPPTWSHADADGILETCKWIWHISHGTLPSKNEIDDEGDTSMAEDGSIVLSPPGPKKILIHCADGYTESTMLGIAYYSYSTGQPVPDAWLNLHTTEKRNFFAYPTDVALLTAISPRLLQESPLCADKSISDINDMIRDEPKWLASLDGSYPSRVLDYMYLGNLGHANNPDLLRALGIRQILSVGETAMWRDGELEAWGSENVKIVQGVQDNGIDPLTDEFESCLKFIDRGRRNGTATLVHCRVGVSRSATICIAEVMRELGLSFPRAYCFVRARRLNVIIQPHLRFAYELLKWEEVLQSRKASSTDHRRGLFKRELEWSEITREIALMNRPYAR